MRSGSRTVVPSYEIPKTTPPDPKTPINPAFAKLEGLVLDMKLLADQPEASTARSSKPLVDAYQDWIDRERSQDRPIPPKGWRTSSMSPSKSIARCRSTLKRIEAGLDLLEKDEQGGRGVPVHEPGHVAPANALALCRAGAPGRGQPDFDKDIDIPENRSWYPFQIAFILLNLPGITKLDHPERSESPEAVADLLLFPTGGGKTEAYLGLTAYTMGLRRLQGTVEGRSGENGVAVLMRYTLRLLTIQQFQRADGPDLCLRVHSPQGAEQWRQPLGQDAVPHRPVGRRQHHAQLDRRCRRSDQAAPVASQFGAVGGVGSPYQLTTCPWCGSDDRAGQAPARSKPYPARSGRTLTYCGDKFGQCLFSKRQAAGRRAAGGGGGRGNLSPPADAADRHGGQVRPDAVEGRSADALRAGERLSASGTGSGRPEIEDVDDVHPKTKDGVAVGQDAAADTRCVRPISSSRTSCISSAGRSARWSACTRRPSTGSAPGKSTARRSGPRSIASTATIRNAEVIRFTPCSCGRSNIFPPTGLDVRDNFFSLAARADRGRRRGGSTSASVPRVVG